MMHRSSLLKVSIAIVIASVVTNFLLRWIWSTKGIILKPQKSYDYIIVGGGTAGSVVARRLWEAKGATAVVVEAGNEASWIGAVPLVAAALQGRAADWAYETTTQRWSHFGMNGRRSKWPRGRALGGSSVINYMVHTWGTRADFEHWADLLQDPGWGYESVRPYFEKVESFVRALPLKKKIPVNVPGSSEEDPLLKGTSVDAAENGYVEEMSPNISRSRGLNGPLPVEELQEDVSAVAMAYLEGARSLGIPVGDLNGHLEDGAMLSQSNILKGMRVSAYDAYVSPIQKHEKLQLLTGTRVTKIVFENFRAVGVLTENVVTGERFEIQARKEVIVCAGVIGTPQLLLLSGLGPLEHLQRLNIPLIAHLPGVGKNLKDHLNVPMYFHLKEPVSITRAKAKSVSEMWRYMTSRTGYLSRSGVETVTRLTVPGEEETPSKMLLLLFNMGSVDEKLFTSIANFQKNIFLETFPETQDDGKEGFILLASCSHPESAGSISLANSDPSDPPLIDPCYLEKGADAKCLVAAMQAAAHLGSTRPLKALGARLHVPFYRRCGHLGQNLSDDAFLECWLRTSAITAHHPVGTCRMGAPGDPLAVLDTKLRVRGVKNLRVVDSSAFPDLVSATPQATVLMLAEKAVDFILEEEEEEEGD